MRDADLRVPSHLQDLGQDDNTLASSVGGYRGRSLSRGSGFCRSPALVFHLRRWERDRWVRPWLAG